MVHLIVAVIMIAVFWLMSRGYLVGYHQWFRWAFAGLAYELVWQVIPVVSADSASPLWELSILVLMLHAGGSAWLYFRPNLGAVVYVSVLHVLFILMGLLAILTTGNLLNLVPAAVAVFVIAAVIIGHVRLKRAMQAAAVSAEQ